MLTRKDIEDSLRKWLHAWSKYDLEEVMALFHDDILFDNWTGGRAEGIEALRQA
jgi:ketosteroid isomerase-like protein